MGNWRKSATLTWKIGTSPAGTPNPAPLEDDYPDDGSKREVDED